MDHKKEISEGPGRFILQAILKKQNYDMICAIAKKYGLCEKEMLRKYWTPSFYQIDPNPNLQYPIWYSSRVSAPSKTSSNSST